ncbi:MAG: M20/M25/M40 family metallo-hydrolase [Nanoarchaeota archaeon]|nr:M20/M25/M40 family metallo-hydrolase [Nanoarchaeota archaeon]
MDLLTKLIRLHGVSSRENKVREVIKKEMKPLVDKIRIDNLGNLICTKGRGRKTRRIMLAAHMDEIGLIIKRFDKKGYVYFSPIGGIDPVSMIDQEVHIPTKREPVRGVVTTKEMNAGDDVTEVPTTQDLFIDTGLTLKELKKYNIRVGLPVEFAGCPSGLSHDVIFGKALDDRIGCYILIELARKIKKKKYPFTIEFVFTVQEEVGLYGAETATFDISPDFAVAVDVVDANDSYQEPSRKIGDGPAIVIKDDELLSDPRINHSLEAAAKQAKVNLQRAVIDIGTTDATRILSSRTGVPASVLSVFVRNIHTTHSVARMSDVKQAILVLDQFLRNPPHIKRHDVLL